ncbi:peptidylprolyl isomerase [Echinicola sp. 20G]|uniref:peptidylprolyl isomerase n=1 Tax=Echinicola sp. 20G TaxID=2781961 RepID=UPI001911058E|nr:peptidylprolyl isomerase [Echinicola sp. 20G]
MKTTYLGFLAMGMILACSPKTQVNQSTSPSDEPQYLLTVGNENVPADEFLHMLSKNRDFNQSGEKLSPEEFEENLSLFIDYKLKVKEAEALGMHESEDFIREFGTFKEDLKKPYLLENSLQEGELRKAYSRMQEVVHAQHILLRFPPNASKDDSIAVLRMAINLKEKAEGGANFGELALEYSQDPSVSTNQGDLGYFTSLQMVYAFEDAVYQLQEGQVSDPVLTSFGYHIIKLIDRKPNPGQVRVSHILVRTDPADPVSEDRARRKITDIYTELQKDDVSWDEVCKAYSEDNATKNSSGNLPWFGVGAFIKEFENAAFSLREEGEISAPVKSPYGYHIIRLEEMKPIASYEEMEESLKSKILRDSRSDLIQSQVVAIQKSKYNFKENTAIINASISSMKQSSGGISNAHQILSGENLMDSTLFSIDAKPKKVSDLVSFIETDEVVIKPSQRNQFKAWLDKFIETSLAETEEMDLLANNEDYRLLIKEYRDGILLFNLMNEMVWQKALKDSAGLQEYFTTHQDQYQWKDRVQALIVKINKTSVKSPVQEFLTDKSFNSQLKSELTNYLEKEHSPLEFSIDQGTYEYTDHPVLKNAALQKKLQQVTIDNKTYIVLLGKQFPAGPKAFNETKGKVIQDYQESLDQNLISLLKENYIIQINEDEKNRIADIVVTQN